MGQISKATTFPQALSLVEVLTASTPRASSEEGSWSLARALNHCSQSIECSIDGYPQLRSPLFRATVGRIARWKFLRQGFMSHDRSAEIPGAREPSRDGALEEAVARLKAAIVRFEAVEEGALKPHLAYGWCTRREYEALHAMHLADHLAGFVGR